MHRWHVLKLRVKGSLFTAYFDGEELFTYHDGTFTDPSAFGLWSKPNNVTYFGRNAQILARRWPSGRSRSDPPRPFQCGSREI